MRFRVSKGKRAAPRATEYLPGLDAQMFAQAFYVLDQIPGSVFFETRMRRALPRSALIEKHHTINFRIEVAPVVRRNSPAWSAVQENDRLTLRVATLLVVKLVNRRDLQPASVERFNRIVKGSEFCHGVRILSLWSFQDS